MLQIILEIMFLGNKSSDKVLLDSTHKGRRRNRHNQKQGGYQAKTRRLKSRGGFKERGHRSKIPLTQPEHTYHSHFIEFQDFVIKGIFWLFVFFFLKNNLELYKSNKTGVTMKVLLRCIHSNMLIRKGYLFSLIL